MIRDYDLLYKNRNMKNVIKKNCDYDKNMIIRKNSKIIFSWLIKIIKVQKKQFQKIKIKVKKKKRKKLIWNFALQP